MLYGEENNKTLNKTIVYTYDVGGNIQSKKEYAYTQEMLTNKVPINTINYTYGNTNWKDQLTSYSGKTITYDAIGNPLTYDGNTYTWQNGRELASITKGNTRIEYKYNYAGIRTSKTVNGVETKYYLDGSKVIYEKTEGQDIIYYFYDENGEVAGIKYKGEQYYFIKNIQNDIIGILNSNLEQIVSYEYDSWGQVISIKDNNGNNITDGTNIGIINPYRYRGYRYDSETKLYYLNSRYYNPEWGRFINADGLLSTGQGILCHNMYAYCENNPVNNMDPDGDLFIKVFLKLKETVRNLIILNTVFQNSVAQKQIKEVQNKINVPDRTNELNKKLKQSASEIKKESLGQNSIQKLSTFANAVKSGSKYDLKEQSEWQETISYKNVIMEPQDIGNFHFGYIGRAMGYTPKFLVIGAGIYQTLGNTRYIPWIFTSSFGDDPRDTYYIMQGVIAYESEN